MTLADGELWNVLLRLSLTMSESATARSFLIGLLAVFISPSLATWVTQQPPQRRRIAFLAAVAPFFAPELIAGYCYSSGVFSLVHLPTANAALYFLLLLLKTVPVGMLVVLYSPGSPISGSAFHCHRLLKHRVRGRGILGSRPASPASAGLCGFVSRRVSGIRNCLVDVHSELDCGDLRRPGKGNSPARDS